MADIQESYFYTGNFYHIDQLLRFKWAKQQNEVFIQKSRGYDTKRKWYLWDVLVNNVSMKMFYDNGEYTFYLLNEKTKKYNYWMTANTLHVKDFINKPIMIEEPIDIQHNMPIYINNVTSKKSIDIDDITSKNDIDIEDINSEPYVCIEIYSAEESEDYDDVYSHSIQLSE